MRTLTLQAQAAHQLCSGNGTAGLPNGEKREKSDQLAGPCRFSVAGLRFEHRETRANCGAFGGCHLACSTAEIGKKGLSCRPAAERSSHVKPLRLVFSDAAVADISELFDWYVAKAGPLRAVLGAVNG